MLEQVHKQRDLYEKKGFKLAVGRRGRNKETNREIVTRTEIEELKLKQKQEQNEK